MPRRPIPTPRCAEIPRGPQLEISRHTVIEPDPFGQVGPPTSTETASAGGIIFLKPQDPFPGPPRGFHIRPGATLELNGLQRAHVAQLEVTLERGATVVLRNIGDDEATKQQPENIHRPVHLSFCAEEHAETPQSPQIIIEGEVRAHSLTIKGPVIVIVKGILGVNYLIIHNDSARLELQDDANIQIKYRAHLPPHLQVEASSRAQFSAGEVVILGYSSRFAITSINELKSYLNRMANSPMATSQIPTLPF